jgi:hypothetical protein
MVLLLIAYCYWSHLSTLVPASPRYIHDTPVIFASTAQPDTRTFVLGVAVSVKMNRLRVTANTWKFLMPSPHREASVARYRVGRIILQNLGREATRANFSSPVTSRRATIPGWGTRRS